MTTNTITPQIKLSSHPTEKAFPQTGFPPSLVPIASSGADSQQPHLHQRRDRWGIARFAQLGNKARGCETSSTLESTTAHASAPGHPPPGHPLSHAASTSRTHTPHFDDRVKLRGTSTSGSEAKYEWAGLSSSRKMIHPWDCVALASIGRLVSRTVPSNPKTTGVPFLTVGQPDIRIGRRTSRPFGRT